MTDNSERASSLKRKYRRQHNLDKAKAVYGTATGVIPDANRPGKVWVRVMTSNGLSVPRSVWAPSDPFAYNPGDPVKLKYDDGRLKVDEADHPAMLSQGVNPLARTQQQNSERTTQINIATLAVVADLAQPTLGFRIKAWNPIVNGIAYQFPGVRTFDELGALALPSTGEMYYVAVFVKDDYATLEAFYSTARGVTELPLGLADVQECLDQATGGSTFVWAQKLVGDQPTITQADLDNDGVPMQQVVNTAAGNGVIVTDGSTTVSGSTTLNFTSGAVVSDAGGGQVDISVSGGGITYPQRATMWHDEALVTAGNAFGQGNNTLQSYNVYTSVASTAANGDTFTNSFFLKAGTYTLSVLGVTVADSGKLDWYVDNVSQFTGQDWYSLVTAYSVIQTGSITVVGDGYHVLKGVINGKNGGSSSYFARLTKYWITPSAD